MNSARTTDLARQPGSLPAWAPWAMAGIVLITILAYLPALSAGWIWDDNDYVTENELLRDFDGLLRLWILYETPQYYPMVFTTFWVEYRLWELNPAGYHAVNVLLHGMNAILLWIVLVRLRVPGALAIALVFALHPIMVESVAWVSERKNVLSLFFYLSAALAYLHFDRLRFLTTTHDSSGGPRRRSSRGRSPWGWYAAALGLFLLALFSKTVTCSLPAALILVMIWQRHPITWQRLLPLAPFFVVGFLLAMNTAAIEREWVGAEGADFDHSFLERTLIATRGLVFYPGKMLWPEPLTFIYPRWEIDASNPLQYLPLVIFLAAGLACLEALRRGYRGPFVALSLYAGTVFPALGYFNVYPHLFSFVADHFVYHASIGFIAFVVGGLAYLLPRPRVWIALGVIVLPGLFALTWRQTLIYENSETLWRDTVAKNPGGWMPRHNLAQSILRRAEVARQEGRQERMQELARAAKTHLRVALENRPQYHNSHRSLAEVYRLLGEMDAALESMDRAVELLPEWPAFHWERGRLLEFMNRPEEAISSYRTASEIAPAAPRFRRDLARTLINVGRLQDGARELRRYVEQHPDDLGSLLTLANVSAEIGDEAAADRLYRHVHDALPPGPERMPVLVRLIRLYSQAQDPAVRDRQAALALAEYLVEQFGGQDPGSLLILASVHADAGRHETAIEIAEQAAEIARSHGMTQELAQIEAQIEQFRAEP